MLGSQSRSDEAASVNLVTLDWVRRRKDKEITAPLYTKLRFVRGQAAFVFFLMFHF